MKVKEIALGFEVGTGELVTIPLLNTAVTGQTQQAGKTTTLEAMATRSNCAALAFITKRGESGFRDARAIPPFFQERADWEFVESILESAMKQRMKFERAWLVKACKNAKTLADVRMNAKLLQQSAKRSMDQDMFMLLGEYLNKVVPLIQKLPKSPNLDLLNGLSVMDLTTYPEELQMLIIASSLRHVHQTRDHVITIIPEAWKMIPQGKKTPVKVEVEKLVREGSGIHNYVWMDSQDMAGVDKLLLRGCPVWVIGVQREMNEVKRALGNMPAGIKKPKAEQVATLGVGQFYVCYGTQIHLTYVQPAWMKADDARAIAVGADADVLKRNYPIPQPREVEITIRTPNEIESVLQKESPMNTESNGELQYLLLERNIKQNDLDKLDEAIRSLQSLAHPQPRGEPAPTAIVTGNGGHSTAEVPADVDMFYYYLRDRIRHDAVLLQVVHATPRIELLHEINVIKMNTTTVIGRIAQLIYQGFLDDTKNGNQVYVKLQTVGMAMSKPAVYQALNELTALGFLIKEQTKRNVFYMAVPTMKSQIVKG